MARRIRLDGPGVAHHVMVRGAGGAASFLGPDDDQDFVDRACRIMAECGARCLGWVLMSNHAHLLVQTDSGALSRVMRRLNTGYAVRFNRRSERRGYVFMDRFRSRIVEGDADLIGRIRYVHRNPLEAGLVASLDELADYAWCGHGALVGARAPFPFEAVAGTLSLFDDDPGRARAELLSWMAREDPPGARSTAAPEPLPPARPEPRCAPRGDLAELLRAACAHYSFALDELRSGLKKPRVVRARSVVAYVAVVGHGERGRAVAEALGVSPSAVSASLDRGRRAAIEDGFWMEHSRRGESEDLKA
jgi:REP element-mobilizing transposase RayT